MLGIEIATWSPIETALITAFFLGVEGFWAWALLIRDEPSTARANGVPDATALRSAATLRAAMAVQGGDPEARRRAERSGRAAIAEFLAWQFLVVAGVVGGFWIFTGGRFDRGIDPGVMPIWIAIVVAPAVLLAIRLATGLLGKGLDAGETQLAGLGLASQSAPTVALAATPAGPRPRVRGEARLLGSRHGRTVEVSDRGSSSTVVVRAEVPTFELSSEDGKLRASPGAPAEVVDAVRPLRRAKRWRGVELIADRDRVTVERRERLAEGWLYDLWLVEMLLDRLPKPT